MQQIGQQDFAEIAPFLNRSFGPPRKFSENPRAGDQSGHAEERVPIPLSKCYGSRSRAIAHQRKARAEQQAADNVGTDTRGFDVQVYFGEVVKREDARSEEHTSELQS